VPEPVAIVLNFDREPSRRVIEFMQQEIGNLFQPAGIQPVWNLAANQAFGGRIVRLRLHGQCRSQFPWALRAAGEKIRLGASAVSEGHVLPFTEIDCDRVKDHLRRWTLPQAKVLGVAVARVLAHELYHILTDSTEHNASGVSSDSITSGELGPNSLSFSTLELERLRASRVPVAAE
jgi:hypothetical protein